MGCCGAKLTKPAEVCPSHRAFTVDIGTEKSRAKWRKLSHDIFGAQGEFATPAVNRDVAFCGVEGNNNLMRRYLFCELPQKASVDLAFPESGAADNDLLGSPLNNFLCAR